MGEVISDRDLPTMGLEGHLEDLGIREILQIVSLSKKSGVLTLCAGKNSGSVSFVDGQVVRATSSSFPEAIGQLLVKENIVTGEQIESALELQRSGIENKPLGAILCECCQIPVEQVEQVVCDRIGTIIHSFFAWDSGAFHFRVGDPETFGTASINPFDFMLAKGLSSQHLANRLMSRQEDQHSAPRVTDMPVAGEEEPAPGQLDEQNLQMLRGMLVELENPYIAGGIIMLILRYASEIMHRAIVFDVRGRQLVGLGQFGLDSHTASADQIVRKLHLDVEADSLFARVLQEKRCLFDELGSSRAEQTLIELLDGSPRHVFLGPLVSDGKVIAMLYGDNYPDDCPIAAVSAFEIFLSKAGATMEKALQAS